MGFLILAKKQTLLQHDFQVCLPLASFYWIQFRHDFQVCLPLSPFVFCHPLSPFYSIQVRHDFQVCLPLSPFYWIQFHQLPLPSPVHHDFEACLSPFVFHSTGSSPIIILRLLPVCPSSTGHPDFEAISLCLPSTGPVPS